MVSSLVADDGQPQSTTTMGNFSKAFNSIAIMTGNRDTNIYEIQIREVIRNQNGTVSFKNLHSFETNHEYDKVFVHEGYVFGVNYLLGRLFV